MSFVVEVMTGLTQGMFVVAGLGAVMMCRFSAFGVTVGLYSCLVECRLTR